MMQCMIGGGRHEDYNAAKAARSNDAACTGRAQMAKWIRFEQDGKTGFGTLEGDTIAVHTGDLFAGAKPNGQTLKLSAVQVLTPCKPSKMICLWNNFHQLAAKNDFKEPKEPLWFLKAPNAYWPANKPIERPATYAGKIIYEGELGVVPMKLSIKTVLNCKERQNYPVADMFSPPHKLVAAISKDVTLMPGDIIACGTSLGAGTCLLYTSP